MGDLGRHGSLEEEDSMVLSMHAYVGTMAKVHLGGGLTLEVMRLEVNLRATDVKLMRQLLIINESIESIKWMIEEKAIASRGSSLSGSLCSLLEGQETSLHGSCNSLQDCSDGLDGISVGSYLDTLVDDVPGHQTPSDMDQFSDSSIMEDSQPLHKHPKIDSDEYYCFG
ncbi:PREDICTED: leucine rich adaptor protein 1-like [Fulmarus glacialis]|nr:PREDICTED: leucine rich adaptor protein 1-like [Fulmarus glacialis]